MKRTKLEAACAAAARRAEDPKYKAQIKRLKQGRDGLQKKYKKDFDKMVEEALKSD